MQDPEGTPCIEPYEATLAILDANDVQVATLRSGRDGRFEVALPPGDYLVVPQAGDPLPVAEPVAVTVIDGRFEEIQVNYDSGIR